LHDNELWAQNLTLALCNIVEKLGSFKETMMGALKMQDVKMPDMKMMDRVAWQEIAGRENTGHENAGPSNRT